jgi:hypothetical protein
MPPFRNGSALRTTIDVFARHLLPGSFLLFISRSVSIFIFKKVIRFCNAVQSLESVREIQARWQSSAADSRERKSLPSEFCEKF